MDGFRVMPMEQASSIGDFFCTVTGNINVIRKEHFTKMKDGAIVANSGHFNIELDLEGLDSVTTKKRQIREYVEEHTLKNGRRVNVLGGGRLINLAAAEGHPSSVMDMSFANQALCSEYVVKNNDKLKNIVHKVPDEIDETIAEMKLSSIGVKVDILTAEQEKYLNSWEIGT